jgi:hypothetical protein
MDRVNYWEFPGFENIYLEDSYLLDLRTNSQIEALVEAVLRESHPAYTPPKMGEQYSYKNIVIAFLGVKQYRWLEKKMAPTRDPDGQTDFGNIDELYALNGKYYMSGGWGRIEIVSDPPTVAYPSPSA